MMRRIDLLPPVYAEQRRERRNVFLAIVSGLLVFLLLLGYWFVLGFRISQADQDLAAVQSRNDQLQVEIAELQSFKDLALELAEKTEALRLVMAGDIDWPAVLTEVALVTPGEIWLTQLTASAARTEGETPVGTETAAIRVSENEVLGRILFQGRSLTMNGIARFMIQLSKLREFSTVYLNNAAETELEGRFVIDFENTVELGRRALSNRFQEDRP